MVSLHGSLAVLLHQYDTGRVGSQFTHGLKPIHGKGWFNHGGDLILQVSFVVIYGFELP